MIKQLMIGCVLCLVSAHTLQAQSKEEQAVALAVERLKKAMIDGSRSELEAITSSQLSYGHSSGLVESKSEFVEKIASGKSDFVSIDLKDQTISVSGKTAIVRHRLDAKINDGGKPGEVHLLILLVFQKENKQWKLLARQAVRVS
jgi:ketosteroid isomerase-like protein